MDTLTRDLDDCVINFDRSVLVTDLLQKYKLPYNEVDNVLSAYIKKQEKGGKKFEKRFLVSGDEEETCNEVYTVVQGESKLQEWLRKLKNAESALYSVEIAGGAKAAAEAFKPMTWCAAKIDDIERRPPLQFVSTNGNSNVDTKPIQKVNTKKNGIDLFAKKPNTQFSGTNNNNATEKEEKKSSPEVKKEEHSPEKQKPSNTKPINKKGIASFFAPSSSTVKSDSKKESGVVKPPTPKKMQDFFKKSEKTAGTTTSKVDKEEKLNTAANISLPLFGNDDDDDDDIMESDNAPHTVVEVDTSDDEAQLETLRKQCKEKEAEDTSNTGAKKRRRIIDSDDEEPEIKHEKKNENQAKSQSNTDDDAIEAGESETFLDDDGFVITIKSKKPIINKKPVQNTSPQKSPPKQETSKKPIKATPKPAAKTKQGNIMNFFSKK